MVTHGSPECFHKTPKTNFGNAQRRAGGRRSITKLFRPKLLGTLCRDRLLMSGGYLRGSPLLPTRRLKPGTARSFTMLTPYFDANATPLELPAASVPLRPMAGP